MTVKDLSQKGEPMRTIEDVILELLMLKSDAERNGLTNTVDRYEHIIAWLRELQECRKKLEIIYCYECIRRRKNTETGEYYCRASGLRNTDYDFCSGGKRAEGHWILRESYYGDEQYECSQ